MDTVPKLVLQNPYRILGVYANSARRDIVANKGRATAFLNVNRPVEFPLDLKGILPTPNRTLDLINEADGHLAIAKEQIKYAQFWFLQKMTPLDDVAFNHLFAGKMSEAKEIWAKQMTLSSLQNKLVCYLIENKPWLAIKTAEKLYEKFGDIYINKVDANCTLRMSGTDLLHQFIDSLGDEVGMSKLLRYELGVETKAYISNQTIGPLISKISSEVDRTKRVDRKNPAARKNAGQNLINATKEPLQQLKGILTVHNPQYQMIADKLGLEILQCGIDYFNGVKNYDNEAPYITMEMLKYANILVVGQIARERCEDQIGELQNYIDNLPPREVFTEDKAIKDELAKFMILPDKISCAIILLNNTKPHLRTIRQKLGTTNEYYLNKSTQIVRTALHNVIKEVNDAQEPLACLNEKLGKMVPSMRSVYLSGSSDTVQMIEARLKRTLKDAWQAIVLIDEFEMENDFKAHYHENRSILKSMCNQMGITTQDIPSRAGKVSTGETLWEHLKSPESSRWEVATIFTILGGLIGFLIYNPGIAAVEEWTYIVGGLGIGTISWIFILLDGFIGDVLKAIKDDIGCGCIVLLACIPICFFVAPVLIFAVGFYIYYFIFRISASLIDRIKEG